MNKNDISDPMFDKMVLVSILYYKNKLSQQEIARKLNISRPWVSKLLSRAEELGIVKIEIDSPAFGNSYLEKQLKLIYDIPYVGVINPYDHSRDYVSRAAVNYFVSQIKPDDVIGIGWGASVSRFLRQMVSLYLPDTQIIPLAASFGTSAETLPNYIAMQLASKLGGTAHLLHVPAFCSSQEEYDALISNEQTRQKISMAEHVDIAIAGIGSFTSSFLLRHNILSSEEVQELKAANAIGDLLLQFIDKDGNPVNTEICRRIIKADIFEIKKNARTVIAMTEGKEKLEMVQAVLSRHLVDAFFTNEETAFALLQAYDAGIPFRKS
ncbi:MAG: winged helix-turn-helix transcriptional regulator [Hespellia sp.]|nr:winged helix-turn-helix transcriptional regulator [Hespellia sp.]